MIKYQYPRINDEKVFEEFIKDLFNCIENSTDYINTEFQLFGKKGQNQKGLDIISTKNNTAIQCKCKEFSKNDYGKIRKKLKEDFENDLVKAKSLKFKLNRLIFTSTFIDDTQLQEYLIELRNIRKVPYSIEYWGWETIISYAERFEDMMEHYFPQYYHKHNNKNNEILTRDDYFRFISEVNELERISVGDYLENKYKKHINANPNFIKILYKDIDFVLDGVYDDSELDLQIKDGDFVQEYGDIKLTGYPNNLINATIYLHQKLIEDFSKVNKTTIDIVESIKRFENDFLGIDYNTSEYTEKLTTLRNKLIKDKRRNKLKNIKLDSNQARLYFKDIIKRNPIFCDTTNVDDQLFIIGVYKEKINSFYFRFNYVVLKMFADKWVFDKSKIIGEEFQYTEIVENFEFATINRKKYLYCAYRVSWAGTAVAGLSNLEFILYDILENDFISLVYSGHDSKNNTVEGNFENLNGIEDNIRNYFEKQVSKCNSIYRPEQADLDFDRITNYEKHWIINNSDIENANYQDYYDDGTLNLTFYSEILPSFDGSNGSISSKIENDYYKIVSLFRNNVLGYDKIKNKYFPIWIEHCNHGCDKEIEFINDWTIKLIYIELFNDRTVEIDLRENKYKIINKK